VPHRDAAANAGRAALLVHALTTAPDLLFEATVDWLHQDYRSGSMPQSWQLVGRLRDDGIPAVVSGAGPTVLVLGTREQVCDAAAAVPEGFRAVPVAPGHGVRLIRTGEHPLVAPQAQDRD
jgi:homoserine kinase